MKSPAYHLHAIAGILAAFGCSSSGGIRPEPAATPAATASTVDTADSIALRMHRYLRGLETLGFSGAIVVEHQGRVVLRHGYGLADRESRHAYTPHTVQSMGSITKQITAVAVLLLEERGQLRTSDSIGRYVPGVPADKRGITLHHLLTHQSGLPEYLGRDAERIQADAFVRRLMEAPLQFEPGGSVGYSNPAYSLLGVIVERVSGRSYEAFVRGELLLPAGMASTGYVMSQPREDALAVGYRNGELYARTGAEAGGWMADGPGWNLRANGGLLTTVDDMHRWAMVLQGRGPLSQEIVQRWTRPHVRVNEELAIGYGWNVFSTELGTLIGHLGGNPAFASSFAWLPEQALFFYVHGNTSLWPAEELTLPLLMAAFDPSFAMPPVLEANRAARSSDAAARAGTYSTSDASIRLRTDDTRLLAELSGQVALDAVLGATPAEREQHRGLSERAREIADRLARGRDDALDGLVDSTTARDRGRRLLDLLRRDGAPERLTVVATVANAPGTRYGEQGGWTTFVLVQYGERARVLNLLWRAEGSYRGASLGPLSDVPSFVLVPTGSSEYIAVERTAPWRAQSTRFEGRCVVVGDARLCAHVP